MASTLGIFLFVVVQRASVPWFLQRAKVDGAYPFSANSIVVSSTFAEILLGVALACLSMGSMRKGIKSALNPSEIRRWWILGISQALSDMLELYANKYMDGSTYQTLLQSKLLVTAIIITFTQRGVRQSSLEWLLLTALSLGLTTYSVLSTGTGGFPAFGTMLAVLKVVLSCMNAVFTERILKQSGDIPIVSQIVHMKIFWCLWSMVGMLFLEGPGVYAPANFFHGWGAGVLLVIATYVIKNWSGTFLLKKLDSLLKNIAEAFAMLVLYLLELTPCLGDAKPFELPTFCVTMMVVLLVWAYLESKKRAREEATGKPTYIAELLQRPLMFEPSDSQQWMEEGRRLSKRYGLLPSSASSSTLRRSASTQSFKIVPNKNSFTDLATSKSLSDMNSILRKNNKSAQSLYEMAAESTPTMKKNSNSGQLLSDLVEESPRALRKNSQSGQLFSDMAAESIEVKEAVTQGSDVTRMNEPVCGFLESVQSHLKRALESMDSGCDEGDLAWKAEVTKALSLCSGLRPYLEVVNWRVSPECSAIAQLTAETDWAALHKAGETMRRYHGEMMATSTQGQMLAFFCSMMSAKRVLEVGMFTGHSTLFMAEALPSNGQLVTIEQDPYLVNMARQQFDKSPHGGKIHVRQGDALDVFKSIGAACDDEERFDLIFIDGDKTQYAEYFELIQSQDLLAPGGLICIDDCLWKGCVYSNTADNKSDSGNSSDANDECVADSMRRLNLAIAADRKLKSVLLPIRNGLALVRRDGEEAEDKDYFSGALQPRQQRQRQRSGLQSRQVRSRRQPSPVFAKSRVDVISSNGTMSPLESSPKIECPYPLLHQDGQTQKRQTDVAAESIDDILDRASPIGSSRQSSIGSDASSLPMIHCTAQRMQTC